MNDYDQGREKDYLRFTAQHFGDAGVPRTIRIRSPWLDSAEEAERFRASLPKTFNGRIRSSHYASGRSGGEKLWFVQAEADLLVKATGRRNRAGVKRYRDAVAWCAYQGFRVSWEKAGILYGYPTQEAFDQVLTDGR